jgi:hypothetical protein
VTLRDTELRLWAALFLSNSTPPNNVAALAAAVNSVAVLAARAPRTTPISASACRGDTGVPLAVKIYNTSTVHRFPATVPWRAAGHMPPVDVAAGNEMIPKPCSSRSSVPSFPLCRCARRRTNVPTSKLGWTKVSPHKRETLMPRQLGAQFARIAQAQPPATVNLPPAIIVIDATAAPSCDDQIRLSDVPRSPTPSHRFCKTGRDGWRASLRMLGFVPGAH